LQSFILIYYYCFHLFLIVVGFFWWELFSCESLNRERCNKERGLQKLYSVVGAVDIFVKLFKEGVCLFVCRR
jgi:hypothetical protein